MSAQSAFQVPEGLRQAVEGRISETDFPRWGLEALVLEAVREGLITRGYAGELLGLGFNHREQFFASRGVSYDLSEEELSQERDDLARMFKQ